MNVKARKVINDEDLLVGSEPVSRVTRQFFNHQNISNEEFLKRWHLHLKDGVPSREATKDDSQNIAFFRKLLLDYRRLAMSVARKNIEAMGFTIVDLVAEDGNGLLVVTNEDGQKFTYTYNQAGNVSNGEIVAKS